MDSDKIDIVTGGAGFIGKNLVERLAASDRRVLILDDLSRGGQDRVATLVQDTRVHFRQVDCADADAMAEALTSVGGELGDVWHLAANSDIPAGVADPRIDLHRTFQTTFNVLELMKRAKGHTLRFASSSAIYGSFEDTAIFEDIGPLAPISNYGAMKLASEAQINAAVESYLPRAEVYRFPNVVGAPATHGVIFDFVNKLRATPDRLEVLGDGTQRKAYLHVDDLIAAMLHISTLDGRRLTFNIGPSDEGVTVRFIAETVRDRVSPKAAIAYGEGPRGWVGDVPTFRYSVQRLMDTGWKPSRSSAETIVRAIEEIVGPEPQI